MFKPRPCGCKGIRTCFVCEENLGLDKVISEPNPESLSESLEFCHLCGDKAWPGEDVWRNHSNHEEELIGKDVGGGGYPFPGVYLQPDFLSEEEEAEMVAGCDALPWDLSQSGRRKQNFGPKTNFKKKKIAGRTFTGFPLFSALYQEKLRQVPVLRDFIVIEQCAIEYRPETGACIDPHIDDCWVWGERVVSLSLLSASTLTMNKYSGGDGKYNLEYYRKSGNNCTSSNTNNDDHDDDNQDENKGKDFNESAPPPPIVRILMPQRSLLVLYGAARYAWEHSIIRKDITERRICMAYREFTPEYLSGGEKYDSVGKDIIQKAMDFF